MGVGNVFKVLHYDIEHVHTLHWRSIRKKYQIGIDKVGWITYAKTLMAMQKEGLSLQVYRGEEEEQQWVRFLGSATKLPPLNHQPVHCQSEF